MERLADNHLIYFSKIRSKALHAIHAFHINSSNHARVLPDVSMLLRLVHPNQAWPALLPKLPLTVRPGGPPALSSYASTARTISPKRVGFEVIQFKGFYADSACSQPDRLAKRPHRGQVRIDIRYLVRLEDKKRVTVTPAKDGLGLIVSTGRVHLDMNI